MNAIEFNDVSFAYPGADRPILAHVDLAIPEGSFALTVGATGSGKSTLLRAINGLVPHFTGGTFSGRVRVEGRDTMASAPRKLSDVVAFVPQDPGASFVMDRVEDELAYAMENLGVDPTTMRRRVEETLDLLDIERLRGRGVRTLSGGERQRVAIASALTAGPRVLVLDEPTSQLDPQGAEDVLAALKRLVDDLGLTVVIAEHRLERVAGFADLALGCRLGLPLVAGEVARVFSMLEVGPPVSRLGRALGWDPPPLTVKAARAERAQVELGEPPAPDAPAPDANVIACSHLRVALGGTEVLRGIDLEVGANEVVALMGRNGAGKTTLLRALTGLITPESGGVAFRGHEPRPGRDVAFCPHDPESVLYRDRVRAEIETTIEALGSGVTADDLLEMFELTAVADSHPRDLSAGERSLVAIAAIAASGADALLLDEPTRGLDPETKQRLGRSLRAWAAEGRCVVFATHDVETAAEFADRVVMLAGGEVIADGSPRAVLTDSVVFATQTARVFGPGWLTPADVEGAVARLGRVPS